MEVRNANGAMSDRQSPGPWRTGDLSEKSETHVRGAVTDSAMDSKPPNRTTFCSLRRMVVVAGWDVSSTDL